MFNLMEKYDVYIRKCDVIVLICNVSLNTVYMKLNIFDVHGLCTTTTIVLHRAMNI